WSLSPSLIEEEEEYIPQTPHETSSLTSTSYELYKFEGSFRSSSTEYLTQHLHNKYQITTRNYKDFLNSEKQPKVKVNQITNYINTLSPKRQKEFTKYVVEFIIRWNSSYLAWKRILELYPAMHMLAASLQSKLDSVSKKKAEKLDQLCLTSDEKKEKLDDSNTVKYLLPTNCDGLLEKICAVIYLSLDELWDIPAEIGLKASQVHAELLALKAKLVSQNYSNAESVSRTIEENCDSFSAELWSSYSATTSLTTTEDKLERYLREQIAHKHQNPLI
ncbi:3352_t:CDS:2, partial [Scutellospora calospora]